MDRETDREMDWDRDRETDRETDREIHWDIDREMDREMDRETDREIGWDRDREMDREMDRETDREIDWDRDRDPDIDREIDMVSTGGTTPRLRADCGAPGTQLTSTAVAAASTHRRGRSQTQRRLRWQGMTTPKLRIFPWKPLETSIEFGKTHGIPQPDRSNITSKWYHKMILHPGESIDASKANCKDTYIYIQICTIHRIMTTLYTYTFGTFSILYTPFIGFGRWFLVVMM